jgi:hypothetical protein
MNFFLGLDVLVQVGNGAYLQAKVTLVKNCIKGRGCEVRPFGELLKLSNFSADFEKPFFPILNVNKSENHSYLLYIEALHVSGAQPL